MASRAHRNVWMLKELALPFDHIPVNFTDGSTREPAYLKINPNGRVPALVDDGFVIFESLAINLYLAKAYPSTLSVKNLKEDALAMQWSFWVTTEIEKPLLLASANRKLFAEGSRDKEQEDMALSKLERPLAVLQSHLASRPYMIDERFTVADLNVATVMDLAPQCGISLARWPAVDQWLTDCLTRPAASDWRGVSFTIPRPPTAMGILKMFV